MKTLLSILLLVIFKFSYGQLDNIHYLQPMSSWYTAGITQEFLYLSTPSTSTITVKITFPDEITSPRLMVGDALGQNELVVTDGLISLTNDSPVRIRFLPSTGTNSYVPFTGDSPITASSSYAGRVIGANEGVGLVLKSDHKFYANYRGRSTNQAGSMLAKGKSALGKHFFWLGLPTEVNPGSGTTINNTSINKVLSIMATEDNTVITLSGYESGLQFIRDTSVYTSDTSHTITLNKGESYIYVVPVDTTVRQRYGFLGSEINSSKNIVVTIAQLMQQGVEAGNRDISFDQIIPVNQLGSLFVAMQGNGSNANEKVIIVATEDDTQINVNGTIVNLPVNGNSASNTTNTLNKGDYAIISGSNYGTSKFMRIEASKNVYVTQKLYGGGVTTSNFMILPPLTCNGQTTIDNIPNALRIGSTNYTTNSRLYLLTRTIMAGSTKVYVDNVEKTPIAARTFTVAPDWTMMVYALSHGNIKAVSNGTIQGQILGANGNAGYGNYFAGFGITPPMSVDVDYKRFDNVCTGNTGSSLLKPINSYTIGTIVWYKDDIIIPGANSGTYKIPETDVEPATYKMILTLPDGCSYYTESIQTEICPCTKQPNTNPGVPFKGIVGISTINNSDPNWPHNVNNAFLTLKSNDKGLVITRNSNPETSIESPVLGMIVYDTDDNCYKLYNGNEWKCLRQKCYDYDY